MDKKIQLIISLSILIAGAVFSQNSTNPYRLQFNCYDTYLLGYTDTIATHYEYTGSDPDILTEEIILKSAPASTKWIKKKADRNCLSADPNDCLVWCLVEIPRVFESIFVVSDTTLTQDWQYYYQSGEEIGFYEDIDLVCSKDFPSYFLDNLSLFLYKQGFRFKHTKKYTKLNGGLRMALGQYQKKHQLLVGGLTNQTYQHLLKSGMRN